jgi:hypothetical protein
MSDTTSVQEQIKQSWQKVPTGERRELATKASLKGVHACLLALIFGVTLAFCFKQPSALLALLAFVPVLYQVMATREWLEGKPRISITYFVAEKTAVRYAHHYQVADYSVRLLFKGTLSAPVLEPLDPSVPGYSPSKSSVWVALFYDRLIMFSENTGGARLEFSHPLGDALLAFSDASDDTEVAPRALYLEIKRADHTQPQRWTLESPYGETLAVCERKIRLYAEEIRAEQARLAAKTAEIARLRQERLDSLRQEQLRIQEERRARDLGEQDTPIVQLSNDAPPRPELGAPAP